MKLEVTNGYEGTLLGLAKNKRLRDLSEKRITKAVRAALRLRYGVQCVTVSCTAIFSNEMWRGRCSISQVEYEYKILI